MKLTQVAKPKNASTVAGALLAIVMASAPAVATESEGTSYTMTVISNQAHGKKVTSGKYDEAIRRITHHGERTRARFADQNNLCVAYAKAVELNKAAAACDEAIAQVRKRESRAKKSSGSFGTELHAYKNDLSVALSNRGVLRAVRGEIDGAKRDFAAAIELRSRLSPIAEKNLDRLEQAALPGT